MPKCIYYCTPIQRSKTLHGLHIPHIIIPESGAKKKKYNSKQTVWNSFETYLTIWTPLLQNVWCTVVPCNWVNNSVTHGKLPRNHSLIHFKVNGGWIVRIILLSFTSFGLKAVISAPLRISIKAVSHYRIRQARTEIIQSEWRNKLLYNVRWRLQTFINGKWWGKN